MATTGKTTTAKKAATKPVDSAAETVEAVTKASKEAVENYVKTSTETFTKNFEKAFGATRERVESAMKGFSDVQDYGRENVEAFVAAGNVFAKGIEAMNAEIAAISKRNFEDSVAAMKVLTGAKSAKEYFELQTDLAKSAWDNVVSDSTKIGEMVTEYSKDAAAPINSRISVAMEKLSKPAML